MALARVLAESFPASPTLELSSTLLVTVFAALVASGVDGCLSRRRTKEERADVSSAFVPLFLAAIYLFWSGVAPHIGCTLLAGSLVLSALLMVRSAPWVSSRSAVLPFSRLVIVVLAGSVFAFYLRTLGPTVGRADTFEFQVVAPTLGVAHPTGYPLYILCGRLFSLLPIGSIAWRVNLTSAVFGTLAVVFLYRWIQRLTGRPLASLIAAWALAFSRVFWSQAIVAEVYALHNMFVAAVLLVLLHATRNGWRVGRLQTQHERESGTREASRGKRRALNPVYVLSLLLGLSFANHLTTALLLPAVGLTLLFVRPRMGWREWLTAVGLVLLGFLLYLYIFFRWPMLHDGVWMSLGEFWRYITGQQFGGALSFSAWRTDPTRYQIVGRLLREPFGWPGLLLAATGLLWLALKRWRVALVTLMVFLAYVWYALSYYVPDVSVFLLPAHLVLAAWLGVGMVVVLKLRGFLPSRVPQIGLMGWGDGAPSASRGVLMSLFALLPLWLLWTNLPLVNQNRERDDYTWGDRVLDLPLASGAAILADSVRIAPLYYLQRIEGRRPDLDMLVLADEATYRAELVARLDAGQTVYLARFLPGLEGLYSLRSLGPLTEVGLVPVSEPPPFDRAFAVRFGRTSATSDTKEEDLELLGLTGPVSGPDGGTGLTLYWRARVPVSEVYHVRLRLVDGNGQVWWESKGRHAANNYYPTPAWRSGEVVADYHEIPPTAIDASGMSDAYALQLGLFRPFSDEGLFAQDGETWVSLTQLALPARTDKEAPLHPLRARFIMPSGATALTSDAGWHWRDSGQGLALLGVDAPHVVPAGTLVELRLHPVGVETGRSVDAALQGSLSLTWTDRSGHSLAAPVVEALGWSRLSLKAPTSIGDYDLRLAVVDQQARFLPARCGWLARPTRDCVLATLRVTGATAAALADFGGRMLLLDTEIDAPSVSENATLVLFPGQTLAPTLSWQGLRPMHEDYTISIQLVGPDGRLHGQTDAWPVQGTLPTSQWSPGKRITDPYRVTLSPDAPPGRYRIGVVVYLLATQTRLALLDGSGRAMGDIAWVGEFDVIQR